MTQRIALAQTVSEMRNDHQVDYEILTKLETSWEPLKIEEPPVPPNDSRNTTNPDDQYLKSIKWGVPTFDGHHDP